MNKLNSFITKNYNLLITDFGVCYEGRECCIFVEQDLKERKQQILILLS